MIVYSAKLDFLVKWRCNLNKTGGLVMPVIMILYYIITVYLVALLVWNFVREKKSVNDMFLYSGSF